MKKKYNWEELQRLYDKGHTVEDLKEQFGVWWRSIQKAVQRGDFKLRSKSENMKLADSKGRLVCMNKSRNGDYRELARKNMKRRIEENPQAHPNRILAHNKTRMSYPERVLYDYLSERGVDFKHNEYVKPYWPDFILGDVIIEVDGKRFHNKEKDEKRDLFLKSKGYKVYRFDSKDIVKNVKTVDFLLMPLTHK